MSGLAVVGLVLVAAGVVLLLAALVPWRRRAAADAARPKTVADLVRMRTEAGTLPGAPVRARIATADPAPAPNASRDDGPGDDPGVSAADSAPAEAPSSAAAPVARAESGRREPVRPAVARIDPVAVRGVAVADLFGDDTPWRRAARIGPGDAWVTVPMIVVAAELDIPAPHRPEPDDDKPAVRQFVGADVTGPSEARDVREQPPAPEEAAGPDLSAAGAERQAKEEEPIAPAEDRPAPGDAAAGPDRSEAQAAAPVWIDPADVRARDEVEGTVSVEPQEVETSPTPRSATAWIDPELVARVSRAAAEPSSAEPPSAGSRPAASDASTGSVRDRSSGASSAMQAVADGGTTVELPRAGTVPAAEVEPGHGTGGAAVAEPTSAKPSSAERPSAGSRPAAPGAPTDPVRDRPSGVGSAVQAVADGETTVEPPPARTAPGAEAEPGHGTGGASAAEPIPGVPRRGRPTPTERAVEQAAADLALLRTFGFADPSVQPGAAPVVAMVRSDAEEPSRPAEGSSQPVRFHVVRRDGADISGAAVTLLDDAGNEVVTGYAGADGRGEVLAPAAGSYVLVCTAHDHQPGAAAISVAAAPVEVEVLVTRSASVSGTVQGEDGPIAGARVTLVQDGEIVESIQTDRSGEYCIDDIGPGEYGLSVAAAGCAPAAIMLEVADEFDLRRDIALQPATPVVDADEHSIDDEMDEERTVDIVSGLR